MGNAEKDMNIDGVDISKIEKPASIGRKPAKPRQPAKSLKEVIEEREVFWKNGRQGDVGLLDALKNIPKDVPLEDCKIWLERSERNSGYPYYRISETKRVCIGRIIEKENPKYKESWEKYEKDKAAYDEKLKEYEEKKAVYDEKMKLYKKYKDAVDFHKSLATIANRSKKLSTKLEK